MNKHHLLHMAEFTVVLFLVFYVAVQQSSYLSKGVTSDTPKQVFKEPPALSVEPKTLQDRLNDFQTIGCVILYQKYEFWPGGEFRLANYTDFRKIAYAAGYVIVFNGSYSLFYTVYDGIIYMFYDY